MPLLVVHPGLGETRIAAELTRPLWGGPEIPAAHAHQALRRHRLSTTPSSGRYGRRPTAVWIGCGAPLWKSAAGPPSPVVSSTNADDEVVSGEDDRDHQIRTRQLGGLRRYERARCALVRARCAGWQRGGGRMPAPLPSVYVVSAGATSATAS